ncbi:zinc-binding dehydrogenase [Nonomuraea jabiensis]|uniref:zinc-binding dehydrogenase n=1 Tax=Nonomuraea jabiensis TaxID=882448 RepID=UPI0016231707|nr:zinc-binding dehydrogenase [Nonomuraea jabiensis]
MTRAANAAAASAAELAELAADGKLEVPIARVYRLDEVRAAFEGLERRRTRGKIVLKPGTLQAGPTARPRP